jgi:transketolase N-terminal domain/subunit
MSEHPAEEQSVSLEQLVISHSYEMLALITVLEKKGILNRQELVTVIQELQSEGKG